ncbi:MAG TPA: HD domain-containing protein [Gammaproteobacteria bacterium]|nr:HD domain-containing protein [Gammaproteobacteria bacterium]
MDSHAELNPPRRISRPVLVGFAALALLVLVGAFLINAYVERERERDLNDWAISLNLIAENRVEAIEDWLQSRTASLQELANNASLQLYLWQLSQRVQEGAPATEPAQLSFLRNLIVASARRLGLATDEGQPTIPANLPQHRASGLALLDAEQRVVVATSGMPDLGTRFTAAARRALKNGKAAASDLILDPHERPLLAIAVPVPAVLGGHAQSGSSAAPQGTLVAVVDARRELYPLLRSGVPITGSDETLLVEKRGQQVVYLSPTRDESIPTRKSLPLDRPRLAAASAVLEPGRFGAFLNYQGREVLAASQPLRNLPWVLLQEVDAGEALQESNRHRRFLITSFSLLLFFVAATLVAAWQHGSRVRALHDAEALREKTLALQKQTELLHAVTDNTEAYILLLDDRQRVLFANARVATATETPAAELGGQSLAGVLGPASAAALEEQLQQLHREGRVQHCTRRLVIGDEERSFQCSLVPVDHVGDRYNAVLLVLQDITELERAQQKHASLLRRLVDTLMHVVDLHDPNSANHSAHLVEIANALGRELQLDEADRRTLDLAASLANLGKIFVPREILTKTEPLTEAEQDLVRRHVQLGLDLLKDLDFEGPVLDTIAQKQEYLDGSGYPHGLRGEQILLTARILAVANAFVALTSPRAYREAIDTEQALDQLLKESGRKYDRRVVAALFHVIENRGQGFAWRQES